MLIVCPYLFGQTMSFQMAPIEIFLDHINKYDSNGNMSGYWCEFNGQQITFDYYTSGKKNGLSQLYVKNNGKYYLSSSGYYCDNIPCSQWQYYYDNGAVSVILSRISKNRDFLKEAKELMYYNPTQTLQGYAEYYDREGNKTSEGWCIFEDDFEVENNEVGRQIHYPSDKR